MVLQRRHVRFVILVPDLAIDSGIHLSIEMTVLPSLFRIGAECAIFLATKASGEMVAVLAGANIRGDSTLRRVCASECPEPEGGRIFLADD